MSLFRVVFGEEDTLFSLMEVALCRKQTAKGEKALRYFFGPRLEEALGALCSIAGRLSLPDVEVAFAGEGSVAAAVHEADVLVVERAQVGAGELDAGRGRLKLVQKFGRDVTNIDVQAARSRGIAVANLHRCSSLSSADNIQLLIMAVARRLVQAHGAVKARAGAGPGSFSEGPPTTAFNWAGVRPIRVLADMTVGFVGMGENSGEVARRLGAMGTRVLYYKRHPLSAEMEARLGGARYCPLDEMLGASDVVTLHVPYGPETERMVDAAFLSKMKPGAALVNTARGGVVDEAALYEALTSGHLGGAALDVYRYEPVPEQCPLLRLDSVLWTPHMSGGEPDFMLREVEDVLAQIARVHRGEPAKFTHLT